MELFLDIETNVYRLVPVTPALPFQNGMISLYTLNAEIILTIIVKKIVGDNKGRVIRKNILTGVAPSTLAAV